MREVMLMALAQLEYRRQGATFTADSIRDWVAARVIYGSRWGSLIAAANLQRRTPIGLQGEHH